MLFEFIILMGFMAAMLAALLVVHVAFSIVRALWAVIRDNRSR